MSRQVKVLLLGSGDSGKTTILKQLGLLHQMSFSAQEVESYRNLVFNNITRDLKYLLDTVSYTDLQEHRPCIRLIEQVQDLYDGQPFPTEYLEPLRRLWADPNVQKAWGRGNEAALPEK